MSGINLYEIELKIRKKFDELKNKVLIKIFSKLEELEVKQDSPELLLKEARWNVLQSFFYFLGIIAMFIESNILIYLSTLGVFITSLKLSRIIIFSLVTDVIFLVIKFALYIVLAKVIWEISLLKLFDSSTIIMPFFDAQILYSWNVFSILSNEKLVTIIAASYVFWGFVVDYLIAKTGYILELVDFKANKTSDSQGF